MQLIFDDLQELKSFIKEFMGANPATAPSKGSAVAVLERPTAVPTQPKSAAAMALAAPVIDAPRRGRPPKNASITVLPKQPKAPKLDKPKKAPKLVAEKAPKAIKAAAKTTRKSDGGPSLTDRIRTVIDKHLANGKEFSANSVYDEIAKKDKDVNKQSVITSVLKQMTSNYTQVKWAERQGNGPRKIKMYNVN
jgi:hypothetical protein